MTGGKGTSPGTWQSESAVASFDVVVRAMELSLARQGNKVWLSAEDFADSYQKLTGRSLEKGFMFQEIVHIIDFVGVKAKKSKQRYVACSYPLTNLAEVPGQLVLGRPVLVGMKVQNSWLRRLLRKRNSWTSMRRLSMRARRSERC